MSNRMKRNNKVMMVRHPWAPHGNVMMRQGQRVEFNRFKRDDEGYVSESVTISREKDGIWFDYFCESKDCDGRYHHGNNGWWDPIRAKVISNEDSIYRDFSAEEMGY